MNTKFIQRSSEKGQAIVLVAALMIALIASLGLAIDGGGMFALYRDMQNATDAAALSAAFALCTGDNPASAGARNAALNGFTDGVDGVTVTINNPPLEGSYAGIADEDNYVHVEITAIKPSYFIQVVYSGPLTVTASTTSQCDPGSTPLWPSGSAIITLGPTCGASGGNTAPVRTTGGGNLTTVGGGIYSNSSGCGNGGVRANGGGSIIAGGYGACTQGSSFETSGGGSISGNQSTNCPTDQLPDPATGYDPFVEQGILTVPTCATDGNAGTGDARELITGVNTPGNYDDFDPDDSILLPGIYCIFDNDVRISGDLTMNTTGDGVFLYFHDTQRISAQGGGNPPPSISLIGINDSTSTYNGFLIWMNDATDPVDISNQNVLAISAQVGGIIRGTVYAPTKHCNLDGQGSGTIYGQFICYSFDGTGGSGTTIIYEEAAIASDPPSFGVTE